VTTLSALSRNRDFEDFFFTFEIYFGMEIIEENKGVRKYKKRQSNYWEIKLTI
jgi:hypothetical protein